jgi:type IV pilus assembly protein PilF
MSRLIGTWVLTTCLLLAQGCSTPSAKKADEPNKARQAAETNTALGRQYMDRGQNEIALEKLKRAVANDKSYAPAHTMLGVLYESLGMDEDAGKEYRLAVNYDPGDGDVNNNYAAFLCSIGKGKEAQQYFETAFKDPFYATPQVAYANAGLCALGMNDLDKAERYLRQSLEYNVEISAALLAMSNLNYRKGEYLNARAFLQRYESAEQETAASLLLGYQIERALGDQTAAKNYKRQLMEQFPGSSEATQARDQK